MQKTVFLLLTLLTFNISFSQNTYGEDFPEASVNSTVINTDTIQYNFVSNYYIEAYKAPMLEGRMLNRYSEIISIQINFETQVVTFKTLTIGSKVFLEKFVKHFRYNGYEIL